MLHSWAGALLLSTPQPSRPRALPINANGFFAQNVIWLALYWGPAVIQLDSSCNADGQVGPVDAPTEAATTRVDARVAQRLAYYKSPGLGALAPRGWYCFEVYGSSGASLFVTPKPLDSAHLFSGDWRTFTGPAIEVDSEDGGTSGRDTVAKVIARVFPRYKAFVQHVIELFNFLEPQMVFGPFPTDKMVYKSDRVVEFRTPPNVEGLGTMTSRLKPNQEPIDGVALLTGEMPEVDLLLMAIRLPPEMDTLKSEIILRVEGQR